MRVLWLGLALWGAVHPMYWFLRFLVDEGWSLAALIDAWYVNDSTTGLVWDLTIAAIALTLWVLAETLRSRDWTRLWAIPATVCIGLSCGLPLYLWLRGRR